MDPQFLESLNARISQALGCSFQGEPTDDVSGGCINRAWGLFDRETGKQVFVKSNHPHLLAMFEAEAQGLSEIAESNTIKAPRPVCWGVANGQAFLVLEWLAISASQDWEKMGRKLAELHKHPVGDRFGWALPGFIGATRQVNDFEDSWTCFFARHRLGWQAKLVRKNGGDLPKFPELLHALPTILKDHWPRPSLVHGDLWSGNAAFIGDGEPVIFDVATYYGDREVDLAMSELFGGFHPAFYKAYEACMPLNPGYPRRRTLYNLYHILNHYNLFGGHYLQQANNMINELLT